MVVKIFLQKPHKVLYIHCGLDLLEFFLQYIIFYRFSKSKCFLTSIICHDLHGKELGRRSWPLGIRLHKKVLSLSHRFSLLLYLLLHHLHALLLFFRSAFHLLLDLVISASILLLLLIEAKCPELRGGLSEELLHLPLVGEELPLH